MAEAVTGDVAEAAPAVRRRPLSKYVHFSYAAPAAPLAMAGLPMAVYLPVVYSEGFGLSLAVIGLVMMLSRISDGITDPLIGYWSDRWRTRWGRRKPWVLIGTPIFAAGMWFLFVPPFEFSDVSMFGATFSDGIVWLFLMLTLFFIGSTMKDLPFYAWGAELSTDYNERSLIMSWREVFNVAGGMIAACTPLVLLFFGITSPTEVVFVLVLAMCIAMPILNLNCLVAVPEWPVQEKPTRVKLYDGIKVVMRNRPYMLLVIVFGAGSIGSAMTNSLSLIFVTHVLDAGDLYGAYLAPYFTCQIAAVPLWFMLSRRIGKHKATMWAVGWYAFWSCFIPVIVLTPSSWYTAFDVSGLLALLPEDVQESSSGVDTGKFLFFIVIMCLKGSAIGALSALPFAMCADVIDVDTAETGKRRAGEYMALWSMVRKGAYAVGAFIGLGLVALWGFDNRAETNTESALWMLTLTYSMIPAVFKFIGMPLLWIYPLTEAKLREVQADISRRHGIAGN